jgi:glycosyltransferase involved in cell wall biosynthesis
METESMRILMLVQSPAIYGPLPKLTPLLIQALQDRGCDVQTAVWGRHTESEGGLEKITGRARDLVRVLRVARSQPFDLMIVQTSHDWSTLARDIPLAALARRRCRIVLQMHGSQSDRMVAPGSGLFKAATKCLLRCSDALLVLSSEEQREWMQFHPRGKFHVVDNPFVPMNESASDPRPAWQIPTGRPILFFAGRLIPEKGIYDLLEAARLVLQTADCHLVLAGDGPEKDGLRRRVEELGLTARVTLAGYLTGAQLASAYQFASLFVFPSYHYEGFPTVVAEAMSFGLPVITTQIRGVTDPLQKDVNALFVPPRNPASLAEAIIKLLGSHDLQARMNIANREKVKQFDPAIVGKKYHNVLKELLSSRAR